MTERQGIIWKKIREVCGVECIREGGGSKEQKQENRTNVGKRNSETVRKRANL